MSQDRSAIIYTSSWNDIIADALESIDSELAIKNLKQVSSHPESDQTLIILPPSGAGVIAPLIPLIGEQHRDELLIVDVDSANRTQKFGRLVENSFDLYVELDIGFKVSSTSEEKINELNELSTLSPFFDAAEQESDDEILAFRIWPILRDGMDRDAINAQLECLATLRELGVPFWASAVTATLDDPAPNDEEVYLEAYEAGLGDEGPWLGPAIKVWFTLPDANNEPAWFSGDDQSDEGWPNS